MTGIVYMNGEYEVVEGLDISVEHMDEIEMEMQTDTCDECGLEKPIMQFVYVASTNPSESGVYCQSCHD